MSRKSLFIGLTVALLAAAAPAGEIKIHEWPTKFVPQEVTSIPVLMDIGFWMEIANQNAKIKLVQIDMHTYEGCVDLKVRTNFNLTLSASITPTGAISGSYSCSIENPDVDVPGGDRTVCAKLKNANLGGQPGGSRNVQVATVTIRVVPRV